MNQQRCETFWGSHGCVKPLGHEGVHECRVPDDPEGGHSQHTGTLVRSLLFDEDEDGNEINFEWSEWAESPVFH